VSRGLDGPFRETWTAFSFADPRVLRYMPMRSNREAGLTMSDPAAEDRPDPAAGEAAPETAAAEAPPLRREPIFNIPAVVASAIGLCTAIHLASIYLLSNEQYVVLLSYGAFIPVLYSGQFHLDAFSFTAPFTHSLLHGSWAHLAINMVWLAAFGSPLANRLGVPRFVIFWLVTALAGAAAHWAVHPFGQAPLIGASGVISGMMGAATRFGFRVDRRGDRPAFAGPPLGIAECFRSRTVVTFLAIWMVVNAVTGYFGLGAGSEMAIAWEAHIGGFVAGFLGIGHFVGHPPRASRKPRRDGRSTRAR
jgi:membrane associated rhomboid family serine protease